LDLLFSQIHSFYNDKLCISTLHKNSWKKKREIVELLNIIILKKGKGGVSVFYPKITKLYLLIFKKRLKPKSEVFYLSKLRTSKAKRQHKDNTRTY
jgi:hypothetical protein